MLRLRPFQRRFWSAAWDPAIDTAALSVPRGNGKSTLAGQAAATAMKRIGPHSEIALCAASIEQARIVFRVTRQMLGEPGFRYNDSSTRCSITRSDGARLRVIGSNGKTAMGLLRTPLVIADEPGSWEVNGGELLWDALTGAQGKPGSPLKIIVIGTLAPSGKPGHWWGDLIARGSHGSTYVQALYGDPSRWDQWPEIRRCNPLVEIDAKFRRKLLEERDEARLDTRLKARFLSYRLNVPTADEASVLLTVPEWQRVCAREAAARIGRPLVGLDLGYNRAWSAATAIWRTGRVEAIAVAPGIPSLAEQEKRDRAGSGAYQRLADAGLLRVAEGLRVPEAGMLTGWIREKWGVPQAVLCDWFRNEELKDAALPCELETRRTRYKDAAHDIRALRKIARDGPLTVAPESRPLIKASLSVAMVNQDTSGSMWLEKRSSNTARDDVAAALILSAGAFQRRSGGQSSRPAPPILLAG